jgi:hypothetical protein
VFTARPATPLHAARHRRRRRTRVQRHTIRSGSCSSSPHDRAPQRGGRTRDHGDSACCPLDRKHHRRPRGALCYTCHPCRREGGPLDGGGNSRAQHRKEDDLHRAGALQRLVASPARDLGEALEDSRGPSHRHR